MMIVWKIPPRAAAFAVLAVVLAASACGRPVVSVPPRESARAALMERIGPDATDGPVYCRRDRVCGSDVLPGFYRARNFVPAWIDDRLELADAHAYLVALRLVAADGLDPANYHLAVLESLMTEIGAARAKGPGHVDPESLADLEMLLTDSFLLCGSHLVRGQVNPETIQSEWFIKGRVEDLAAALEKGLSAHDVPAALDSLRPGHAVYRGLLRAYREYAALASSDPWPGCAPGPKLVAGDRDERVKSLRATLAAMGEISGNGAPEDPALFDDPLEASVKAFQRRHGLEPDGVLGAGTVSALNVTAAERLKQVRANLERWRWITQDLGERYVLVNVADYRVSVHEAGREILSMPAIVGRAYRQTPDFSGRMSTVTFNPFWNVPPRLAREDILPKVKKDLSYLTKKGFRVFKDWSEGAREIDISAVDWQAIREDGLSFKFRQDPGPQNSLGRILFQFPNKHDVYIHDTSERGLFSRAVRNLSSGCIRVAKPLELAAYVLGSDPAWTEEAIAAAMAGRETKVVRIKDPLGVHVLYWTAWLGDDGRVQFRQDIYLRDAALVRALDEQAAGSAR